MRVSIDKSSIKGEVFAPSSKSYTHRAITLAALSKESIVRRPLISADTLATIRASELFGALIERMEDKLIIHGNNGKPKVPDDVINAANSGTTLRQRFFHGLEDVQSWIRKIWQDDVSEQAQANLMARIRSSKISCCILARFIWRTEALSSTCACRGPMVGPTAYPQQCFSREGDRGTRCHWAQCPSSV